MSLIFLYQTYAHRIHHNLYDQWINFQFMLMFINYIYYVKIQMFYFNRNKVMNVCDD